MTKAVIFDLDGTLLYTPEDLTDSVNYVLSKFDYPNKSIEEIKNFVGDGVVKLMERSLPENCSNFDECLNDFKKHYFLNMCRKTKPYDGIVETLLELKKRGYKTAVVSNKFNSAVERLCKKYFPNLIDIAAGTRDNIPPKPAPDLVNEVISKLNPQKCVFVGDSEVDIQTAKNAGIDCVSVAWGYKDADFLHAHGASIILKTPKELLEKLQ